MKNWYITICSLVFFATLVVAQPQPGYYNAAIGKSGAQLKTALFNIIKEPSVVSYSGLWTSFQSTDAKPNGNVWDMYSNCDFTFVTDQDTGSGGTSECEYYNREHSFPKSWFNDESPMYSDLFHLYPTDKKVNNSRGNLPYGEVANANWTSINGSKVGAAKSGLGSGTVFEPIDEYKGDFARTYFYMITCYQDKVSNWDSPHLSGSDFNSWTVTLLLKWHRQDIVSSKEQSRNDAVEDIQFNRNPFIDYPELAEYIWGNRIGEVWSNSSSVDNYSIDYQIVNNPVQNNIQIKTPETNLTYTIYNVNGHILKAGSLDADQISIPELNNGIYLLQLQSGNNKAQQKIIVIK